MTGHGFRHEFRGARVVATDRHGGVSAAPYDSLNLAVHVGDDRADVAANRALLARTLPDAPDDPAEWIWLDQVHGRTVVTATAPLPDTPEADAVVTAAAGLPLVVMAADCATIALVSFDDDPGRGTARAVGAVHAGWAGLLAGVVESAVDALRALHDGPVVALLGPCIHAGRYEFGADALVPLVERFGPAVVSRTDWGTPALDLPAAVGIALRECGVVQLLDVDVCTSVSPDHFSHRRDGVTGRHALVVVKTA